MLKKLHFKIKEDPVNNHLRNKKLRYFLMGKSFLNLHIKK